MEILVEKLHSDLQALQLLVVKRLHKTMAFIGMQKLPSFMVNDVFKHPTIEADMERFKAHLKTVYGA